MTEQQAAALISAYTMLDDLQFMINPSLEVKAEQQTIRDILGELTENFPDIEFT